MKLRAKASLLALMLVVAPAAVLAQLAPELQAKVDGYKQKLVEWAAHPAIVAAVKESNAAGGLVPGMNNGKWDELAENDPVVKAFQTSEAGKHVTGWEGDAGITKLYLRDEKGNVVASSSKPLLYNNGSKPPFVNAMKGAPWNATEVKPDPASQVKGVHISVPVLDGGKVIGVLHSSVAAQ